MLGILLLLTRDRQTPAIQLLTTAGLADRLTIS
jgi:hypothetical protein